MRCVLAIVNKAFTIRTNRTNRNTTLTNRTGLCVLDNLTLFGQKVGREMGLGTLHNRIEVPRDWKMSLS